MVVLKNSIAGRLLLPVWYLLCHLYQYSFLARLLRAGSAAWSAAWGGSVLAARSARGGGLARAWRHSAACAVLNVLINLPVALCHWVYLRLKPVFDGSVAAPFLFGMGEQVPVSIGWLMLALLLIPYEHWSNTYSLLGFAFVLLLFLAGGMRRRSLRLDAVALGPYAAFFALAVCLAWPLSAFPALSTRFLLFHLTCMLCVVLTVSTIERPEQLQRLVAFAVLALACVSLYGFFQRIQGVEVNPSWVDLSLNEGMPGRVFAGFENPNSFAHVLVLLIPLAVALMLGSAGWGGRIGGAAAALLGCGAILMTYSRASWIGLAAAALVFVFLWNRRLLPPIFLAALVLLPVLPDSVFNRILTMFNVNDTSTSSRFPLYSATLRLLGARPLLGAGLGTDAVRRAVADLNLYHGVAPYVHAHNVYLQVWAETGLLGILSFLGAMGWGIRRAFRAVAGPHCPRAVRLITIGGASALCGILVCGLADYIWTYPRVMLVFWFLFAVTLAGIRLAGRAEAAPKPAS